MCVLGMAQGVFLMHGVRLKVDHEDVQRLQQVSLLQHVSQMKISCLLLLVLEKEGYMMKPLCIFLSTVGNAKIAPINIITLVVML